MKEYFTYCDTEKREYSVSSKSNIFTCPNDATHTIDRSKIRIGLSFDPKSVSIIQENNLIGRYIKVKGYYLANPANQTTTHTITWPTNIAVLSSKVFIEPGNIGDEVDVYINPNTAIGVITQPLVGGETSFTVNDTVMQFIDVGFDVNITDGVNNDFLGTVTNLDYTNNTITVSNAVTNAFAAMSGILMSIHIVESLVLNTSNDSVDVGYSNLDSSFTPQGTSFVIVYQNKHLTDAHNFNITVTYFY